jgi:hypothetical protein
MNDEQEKLRQAGEWLLSGTPEQRNAAAEHLGSLMIYSPDPAVRTEARAVLLDALGKEPE